MKVRGDTVKEGDVFLSNHPTAGGSHLPDLTVITPVSCCYSLCIFDGRIIKINTVELM